MGRDTTTDDVTEGDTAGGDDTYTYDETTAVSTENGGKRKGNPILKKLFASCEDDALGSVHRAWAVTVLFMVVFFIVSIIEGKGCFVCCIYLVFIYIYIRDCNSMKIYVHLLMCYS